MNQKYVITAEPKYRRVYQGTLYTVSWITSDGVEHKATSRNFLRLSRFARNGFSLEGLPSQRGIRMLS